MSASPNSNILLNGSLEGGTVTTATSGENAVSTNTLRCQDSTAAGCGGRRPGGGYYPESSTDQSRPNLRAALDRIPPSERNIVLYYGTPDQYDYMNKLSELKAGTIRPLPRACADMTTLVRPCWEPNMTDQQAALMMRPYRTSTLTSQVRPDGQVTYNSGEATTTIPIWPPQVPRRRADQVGCPEMPEGRESGESLSDLIDAAMPPDEAANCKTQARGRVTNSLDAMDAAAATSLLGLINLGGAAGSTEQDSDISSESMSSGCTDVITTFANTLIAENSIILFLYFVSQIDNKQFFELITLFVLIGSLNFANLINSLCLNSFFKNIKIFFAFIPLGKSRYIVLRIPLNIGVRCGVKL